jgi:hypothetical protein
VFLLNNVALVFLCNFMNMLFGLMLLLHHLSPKSCHVVVVSLFVVMLLCSIICVSN